MSAIPYFYYPSSISVVGVSPREDNFATIIFKNLLESKSRGLLKADIYPVNPLYESCLGFECLKEVPKTDLTIISVPSSVAYQYVDEADRAGVKAAIVISGGFSEVGGERLIKRELRMRVLGPNTIGIVNAYNGLNTLFLPRMKPTKYGAELESLPQLKQGKIAVITQSGGVSVSLLDELLSNDVGISYLTCLGNSEDVTASDVLDFLAEDERTEVALLYVEGIKDGLKFLKSATRFTSKKKAFAVIAGKSQTGRRATVSHTASIIKNYTLYMSAFRQAGIVVVDSLRELVNVARVYDKSGLPRDERVAVITNSGGAGVLAADELGSKGISVPDSSKDLERLKAEGKVPAIASLANPIDVSASGRDESIIEVYRTLSERGLSNFIIISTHYPPGISDRLPEAISSLSKIYRNFNIAVELGRSEWSEHLRKEYMKQGIPVLNYPEEASDAAYYLIEAFRSRPSWKEETISEPTVKAKGLTTNPEDFEFLKDFGFSLPGWGWVEGEEELRKAQYPIVLKVYQEGLVHKTEAGAIKTNIKSLEEAYEAFKELRSRFPSGRIYYQEQVSGIEVRVGVVKDEVFGHYINVGFGGILTELLSSGSTYICPVDKELALKMLHESKIYEAISGFRGIYRYPPESFAEALSKLSKWAYSKEEVEELEVNPLIINSRGMFAADFRMKVLE